MALRGKDRIVSADEDEAIDAELNQPVKKADAPFTQRVAAQQRVRRYSDSPTNRRPVIDEVNRPVTDDDDGGDWERPRSSHKDRRRAEEHQYNNNQQSVNSNHIKK